MYNTMTLCRIEPATYRLVALYLNQLRHRLPQVLSNKLSNFGLF